MLGEGRGGVGGWGDVRYVRGQEYWTYTGLDDKRWTEGVGWESQ